jgi:cytochrome b pre-mRNA-processing protein 3
MILPAFRRSARSRSIDALYGMIVAQARMPVLYTDYGVPDTMEGRFDLLVLHLVLILRRLGRDSLGRDNLGQDNGTQHTYRAVSRRDLGQSLFDAFCRDLDANLREMGTGDLAVPKKMRSFGEAFYGRQAAYAGALADANERELETALARNIFSVAGTDSRAARLARYVRAVAERLDCQEEADLTTGAIVFPDPAAISEA